MQAAFIDTHCHIHDSEFASRYDETQDQILVSAADKGVSRLVCVGTDVRSSEEAVTFVQNRANCYASIAMHPHEAIGSKADLHEKFQSIQTIGRLHIADKKLVAIGECGLDYYYHDSTQERTLQQQLLLWHLELAEELKLPVIFHIREAFDDFFKILDRFSHVRGVVHSFSADNAALEGIMARGLYVGLNGIMTFTKNKSQLEAAKAVPLDKMLLETDAPFLTPAPFRGKVCRPEHVIYTAKFMGDLLGVPTEVIARNTTENARLLFGI